MAQTGAILAIVFVAVIFLLVIGVFALRGRDDVVVPPPPTDIDALKEQLEQYPVILPIGLTKLDYKESFVVGIIQHDIMSALTTMEADNVILKSISPTNDSGETISPTSQFTLKNPSVMWPNFNDRDGVLQFAYRLSPKWGPVEPRATSSKYKEIYEVTDSGIYVLIVHSEGEGGRDLVIADRYEGSITQNSPIDLHSLGEILLKHVTSENFLMFSMISVHNYRWDDLLEPRWPSLLISQLNIGLTSNEDNFIQMICTTSIAPAVEIRPGPWSTLRFTFYPKSSLKGFFIGRYDDIDSEDYNQIWNSSAKQDDFTVYTKPIYGVGDQLEST